MTKDNKQGEENAKQTEYVEISRRERRLREKLLTVDEDTINDEKRLHANGEYRKERLSEKINIARERQEAKLNRRNSSKLYKKSHLLYMLTSPFRAIGRGVKSVFNRLSGRRDNHKRVTPHRSFYLTTHAKAVRQINISGYGRFIHEVARVIWDNKWLYLKVLIILTLVLLSIIGLGVKQNYIEVRNALQEIGLGGFLEWVGMMTQAIITSVTVADINKQTLATVILVLAWLTLVYIARNLYAGNRKIKLRDAMYNSAGPIIPLMTIFMLVMIQLLPLALTMIVYSSVSGAGYINQGIAIENMAAWCVIAVVAIMTVYWMITSLLSTITVTIPGIYPMRAYFETSIMVAGRRVKILLRVLMGILPLILLWLVTLTPVILLDAKFRLDAFPIVQIVTTALVAASIIWASVYLYMLYRRLLDSPEQPIGTPNSRFVWPWKRKKRSEQINQQIMDENSNNKKEKVKKSAQSIDRNNSKNKNDSLNSND